MRDVKTVDGDSVAGDETLHTMTGALILGDEAVRVPFGGTLTFSSEAGSERLSGTIASSQGEVTVEIIASRDVKSMTMRGLPEREYHFALARHSNQAHWHGKIETVGSDEKNSAVVVCVFLTESPRKSALAYKVADIRPVSWRD